MVDLLWEVIVEVWTSGCARISGLEGWNADIPTQEE